MKRVARWGLGTLAALTVLVTAAHLPPISGWLGWNHHAGGGKCPFGYDRPAVASVPAAHRATPGPSVLGFALGATTRSEVDGWARSHAVSCHDDRGELVCGNTPAAVVGGLDAATMWFGFATDGTLAHVRTVREAASADAVAAEFQRATAAVSTTAGAPTRTAGDATPATLAKGALRQASAEFRRDDFRATVRATNMGARGYVLTESYAI
jgi:hypothetical protein